MPALTPRRSPDRRQEKITFGEMRADGAAIHEAGHAVVAWALGLEVRKMVIGIIGDVTAGEADPPTCAAVRLDTIWRRRECWGS
jgi:hypothetical protein